MHPVTISPSVETWTLRKPAVAARGGVVTSQHHLASDIGAKVLAEGGNAVDAAVSAGLAIGTLEPWMSGLGGGGYLLVRLAQQRETWCVEFGMRASRDLDPSAYPLAGGADSDLFAWPAVLDQRNVQGPLSIAVPGLVAGHALALERFGTRSWRDALQPAIEQARAGLRVDWYTTLKIASEARALARHPESARTYLPEGLPPSAVWDGPAPVLRLGRLADTLERLAHAGPRDFYEGEVAVSLVQDAREAGCPLSAGDLRAYRAALHASLARRYRDATVHGAPGLTAGPTLMHALSLITSPLAGVSGKPDAAAYRAYAEALRNAYEHRLATLGEAPEAPAHPACTTHLSVVDGRGNAVALTQTLLSLFGSRVMFPRTGLMMNNGVMWFDPRPGRPNSIRPGLRPLSNMCPSIVERGDGATFALGASGGRRILPAVFQMVSFLVDYGADLESVAHLPRIDVSGGPEITADPALGHATHARLAELGPVLVAPNAVSPALYACPNLAACDPERGVATGAAYVPSPWAKASGASVAGAPGIP